jgi:hypothetical protein
VARERTTKGLAKRIELTYYQRLHPFRRLWRILCIALVSVAALWLIVMAVMGDQRIYTSGPVATAHRMFNLDCERCHVDRPVPVAAPAAKPDGAAAAAAATVMKPIPVSTAPHPGGFFRRVSDGACYSCHDATDHHANAAVSLRCAECHLEHKVETTLARMSDRHCVLCHADLKLKSGTSEYEKSVVSLARHPEFAVFRKNVKDATQIKLNHDTHQKPDLPAGGGKRLTLGCTYCHVQDDAGKYMKPISYDLHCKQCHPLEASADVVVPHQRPEIIRGFLLARSAGRGGGAAAAPAAGAEKPAEQPAAEEAPKGGRKRGGGSSALPQALVELVGWVQGAVWNTERPPIELVQRQRGGGAAPEAPAAGGSSDDAAAGGRRRGGGAPEGAPAAAPPAAGGGGGGGLGAVVQLEKALYEGRSAVCPYCHLVEKADPLPRIVPPKIPVRWLPHSSFDHRAHRPLACLACHPEAKKSTDTADVLLPKMAVCQECHREGGGARAGCVECHLYHDRSKERSPDGPHTVPQFAVRAGRPTAAPATKP